MYLGPPPCEGCGPPGGEPQPASSQGLYGLHPDHLPRTDGVKYEGLPCCFYEEKQVARGRGGGGCYTEDCSVRVQYTLAQEPPVGCHPGARDLSQRVPIIPEDVGAPGASSPRALRDTRESSATAPEAAGESGR